MTDQRTVVVTANIRRGLPLDVARTALRGVLDIGPDLVGLQEWNLSRAGLLLETGRLGLLPAAGIRLGRASGYLWTAPLIGGCPVGARVERYEQVGGYARRLSRVGHADKPDRWLGVEPPRVLTAGIYRDRRDNRTVALLNFHLVPGVQAGGRYRADRPLLVARHRREVHNIERLVARHLGLGHVVYAVGDSNYDGLRLSGLTSAWEGREADPGTLGPRRKVDDVHGPGSASAVRLLLNDSDHKAVVVERLA
ncbi:MAG: hypothetical protein JWN91_4549 [Nocardioides sp.]|nr:hypothetical protein [Nocardioides sp.]